MATIKIQRLKASTLLEVIVAMVVVLVVFVLAVGIYANVMRSSPSVKQQYVRKISERLIQESIKEGNWTEEELQKDSLILKKEVKTLEGYSDLVVIEVTALEHGKEISRIKEIVKKEEGIAKEGGVENKEAGHE